MGMDTDMGMKKGYGNGKGYFDEDKSSNNINGFWRKLKMKFLAKQKKATSKKRQHDKTKQIVPRKRVQEKPTRKPHYLEV